MKRDKLKIAVHIDNEYPNSFGKKWIEYINLKDGFEAVGVNLKAADVFEQISGCDAVMWHFRHNPIDKQAAPKILCAIEKNLNIPVWPNIDTRWHFDEKISQHYLFQAAGIPHVPSWVFWNYNDAERFLKETKEYPLVFKLSVGAGSANIIKVNNYNEAVKYLKKMFGEGIFPYTENEFSKYSMEGDCNYPSLWKRILYSIRYVFLKKNPSLPWYYQIQKDYLYVQKFIPNNLYDIRITVIGNRAFGFTRRNRPNDFRASGSGEIEYSIDMIPMKAVKIAHELSFKYNFQSMAYDFLIDSKGELLINEISYGFNSMAVEKCSGYWDRNLVWYNKPMTPQEAHVEDFIEYIQSQL